jgi:hypothetical protein
VTGNSTKIAQSITYYYFSMAANVGPEIKTAAIN